MDLTLGIDLASNSNRGFYFSFDEDERGTLSQGKLADLVVLDRNPMKLSPEEIADCRVKMTVVGGKIVYNNLQP